MYVNNVINIEGFKVIRKIGEGRSGNVYLLQNDIGDQIVKKEFKKRTRKRKVKKLLGKRKVPRGYKNEVRILKKLNGNRHFPRLIYHDDSEKSIYMEYCGSEIALNTPPLDWKTQLFEILTTLKSKKISHNSTHKANICVKNGIIYYIDFSISGKYRFETQNLNFKILNGVSNMEQALKLVKKKRKLARILRRKPTNKELFGN